MRSKPWAFIGWLSFASLAYAEPATEPADAVPEAMTAPAETPHMRELRARLDALRPSLSREASVRTAAEQADLALERAQLSRAAGDEARAQWAEQLAEAATSLAERRLLLAQERDATRAALAQRRDARALVTRAKEALTHATKHAAEKP